MTTKEVRAKHKKAKFIRFISDEGCYRYLTPKQEEKASVNPHNIFINSNGDAIVVIEWKPLQGGCFSA